jgi:hypothetical protein
VLNRFLGVSYPYQQHQTYSNLTDMLDEGAA